MIELGILLSAVVVLAVLIDHVRGQDFTGIARRCDPSIDARYRVVSWSPDRDVVRMRRRLRRP